MASTAWKSKKKQQFEALRGSLERMRRRAATCLQVKRPRWHSDSRRLLAWLQRSLPKWLAPKQSRLHPGHLACKHIRPSKQCLSPNNQRRLLKSLLCRHMQSTDRPLSSRAWMGDSSIPSSDRVHTSTVMPAAQCSPETSLLV